MSDGPKTERAAEKGAGEAPALGEPPSETPREAPSETPESKRTKPVKCEICCREIMAVAAYSSDHPRVLLLPCGAVFHARCFAVWRVRNGPRCPHGCNEISRSGLTQRDEPLFRTRVATPRIATPVPTGS